MRKLICIRNLLILLGPLVWPQYSLAQFETEAGIYPVAAVVETADTSQETQRRFEAHRRLYNEILSRNFQRLGSTKVIGLEFIFAGPSNERIESNWGHALLRFVDDDADPFNDLVASFVADVSDPEISFVKGMFGGYSMAIELLDLGHFLRFYVESEGRYLDRFILQTTPNMLAQAKAAILASAVTTSSRLGRYGFLTNNCSLGLAAMFTAMGFPATAHLMPPTSPSWMQRYIQFRRMTVYPGVRVKTLYEPYKRLADYWGLSLREIQHGRWRPANGRGLEILGTFDLNTLVRIYVETPLRNRSMQNELLRLIKERKNRGETWSWGLERLGVNMYRPCLDRHCVQTQLDEAGKYWSYGSLYHQLGEFGEGYYSERMNHRDADPEKSNLLYGPLVHPLDISFKYFAEGYSKWVRARKSSGPK